jgi:hypothetical protein
LLHCTANLLHLLLDLGLLKSGLLFKNATYALFGVDEFAGGENLSRAWAV